jgi:photosystem II stability/assembly factor-like uncharacterized protein
LKGQPVPYAVRDPRDGSIWASIDHGHWGSKLSRSTDDGATFQEVTPPKYPAETGKTARYYWVLQPGHRSEPNVFWVGTEPGGLFKTSDQGKSWTLVQGLWDLCVKDKWTGGGRDEPGIHSILIDPKDPRRMVVAVSCAGVVETRDGGATWSYRNEGMKAVTDEASKQEYGHDPHCLAMCAAAPNVIWQANHVGVYRSTDGAGSWKDLTRKPYVHFGFPVAVHPRKPDVAWVVPMDGDGARMAVNGSLVVMRTQDGGASWAEQRAGLPQADAWDFPFRHGLDASRDGTTLAFGTSSGNVYVSPNGGTSWRAIAHNLPIVYSLRFA